MPKYAACQLMRFKVATLKDATVKYKIIVFLKIFCDIKNIILLYIIRILDY